VYVARSKQKLCDIGLLLELPLYFQQQQPASCGVAAVDLMRLCTAWGRWAGEREGFQAGQFGKGERPRGGEVGCLCVVRGSAGNDAGSPLPFALRTEAHLSSAEWGPAGNNPPAGSTDGAGQLGEGIETITMSTQKVIPPTTPNITRAFTRSRKVPGIQEQIHSVLATR